MKELKAESAHSGSLLEIFVARVEAGGVIEVIDRPSEFVSLLQAGVSGEVLRPVTKHIPKRTVANAVGADVSNFSKLYRRKALSGYQTESLNDLTELWAELREVFMDDEEMIKEWIEQPLPILDGAKPNDLIGSQYGRDVLRDRLDEMRSGEFA